MRLSTRSRTTNGLWFGPNRIQGLQPLEVAGRQFRQVNITKVDTLIELFHHLLHLGRIETGWRPAGLRVRVVEHRILHLRISETFLNAFDWRGSSLHTNPVSRTARQKDGSFLFRPVHDSFQPVDTFDDEVIEKESPLRANVERLSGGQAVC